MYNIINNQFYMFIQMKLINNKLLKKYFFRFLAYFCWEDFSSNFFFHVCTVSIIIVTLDNHIEISVLFNMTFDTFSTKAKMFTYI